MATSPKKTVKKTTISSKSITQKGHQKKGKGATQEAQIKSFQKYDEKIPFMTFRFTIQSLYWLILSGIVLVLGIWVIHLNNQIQEIYDQIEYNNAIHESSMPASQPATE